MQKVCAKSKRKRIGNEKKNIENALLRLTMLMAFDTNILTLIFLRDAVVIKKLMSVPATDQCVPIVVLEEVLRGRMDAVRKAQSGQGSFTLVQAYGHLERAVGESTGYRILSFNSGADGLVRTWQPLKLKIGVRDERIAAIAVTHGA